jgi:hypothetical protein
MASPPISSEIKELRCGMCSSPSITIATAGGRLRGEKVASATMTQAEDLLAS